MGSKKINNTIEDSNKNIQTVEKAVLVDINNQFKPDVPKKSWSKRKIITILILAGLLITAPILFTYIKTSLDNESFSHLSDQKIIEHINKIYPNIVTSLENIKISPVRYGCSTPFPCDENKIYGYNYEGFFYSKGTHFSMPFEIFIGTEGRDDSMDSINYFSMPTSKMKDEFITIYNSTGEKTLGGVGRLNLKWQNNSVPIDTSGILLAGYKYNNLYESSSVGACYINDDDGVIKPEGDYAKGCYIFYYDEQKEKWLEATDNGQYLIDWIYQQGENNLSMSQINWSNSPIKPYVQ